MEVGVSLIVRGSDATQQNLASMATHAEAWGFDSVWASDHPHNRRCLAVLSG